MAERDSFTCDLPEFSSKWQTRFSHLRGGSYNHTVVHTTDIELIKSAAAEQSRRHRHPR
jgi:hypothetical protein